MSTVFAAEQSDVSNVVDFVVNVEEGRDAKVLQLTDPQVIESEQQRYSGRLGDIEYDRWRRERREEECKKYIRQVVRSYNLDLIIITGDIVYGEFDDTGEVLLDFIGFMDSFEIPWAPVFGNHDNESAKGADWQCKQLENSAYCLFRQRELTGNGNYTVGIMQGGKLQRVFFMMDSNGCGGMSAETYNNGHSTRSIGFGQDQMDWYEGAAKAIKADHPDTKLSFAFHIQPLVFQDAMAKYGFPTTPIDLEQVGEATDFGYMGTSLKSPWDSDYKVWNSFKKIGVDSVFVGHEHSNSASVVYEGIRLQYGQKSSTYDRANYLRANGTVAIGSYVLAGTPIIGGTAIALSADDGSIVDSYIVYYEEPESGEDSAENSKTFDANGTDFDAIVNIPELNGMTAESDDASVPAGYMGGVYKNTSSYLAAIGIKIRNALENYTITGVKVRMYVVPYTASKTPLIRIYDDENNHIRAEGNAADMGLVAGQWCDVDITPLLKTSGMLTDGVLNECVLVYRFYDAAGDNNTNSLFYIDSMTVEYSGNVPVNIIDDVGKVVYTEYSEFKKVSEKSSVISAQYDSDGKLKAININTYISEDTRAVIPYENGITTIKIFIWELSCLYPFSPAVTINI